MKENGTTTLEQQAYNTLLQRIIDITYEPGTVLNEQGLVSDLGISRTPIHAACIRLQQDGMIEFLPKKGLRVTTMDADFIRDIHDMRDLIEPYVLERFGRLLSKDHLIHYLTLFKDSSCTEKQLYDLDLQMHTEFVMQAHNRLLDNYYGTLKYHMARIANLSGKRDKTRLYESNKEHVNILIPLIEDDIPTAVEALKTHLKVSREVAYRVIVINSVTNPQKTDDGKAGDATS